MTATAKRTPKQDPAVKGNPWLVEMLGDNKARVPSASVDGRSYIVDLAANHCPCDAHVSCWHLSTAELRGRLDVSYANSFRRYSQMRLTELQAEDARLRGLLTEQDDHSIRAQQTALGEAINALFYDTQTAA